MRLTQGAFSFLPDLTDAQITAQVQYCLDHHWSVSLEYTDDPHPRNTYWEMWGPPMFDLIDTSVFIEQLAACRAAWPGHYIRVAAFDSTKGWESVRTSFIVQRPAVEVSFRVERRNGPGRSISYSLRANPAKTLDG
ncbi:MAG: ribulose bisphosphate carboxylase small subunit [Actinomycetota bacterium]